MRQSLGFIEPCLPTTAKTAPRGPQWVYEIKHDGYRLIVRRQGARVNLYTRRGYDWSDRFPWITEAVGKLRIQSAVFDGQAVSGVKGNRIYYGKVVLACDGRIWKHMALDYSVSAIRAFEPLVIEFSSALTPDAENDDCASENSSR